MRSQLLALLLLFVFTTGVTAQSTRTDSIAKIAKKDAKHYKVNKQAWQMYKKGVLDPNSDILKPNAALVSDSLLLKDSVYVKAYRAEAYKKTSHRRTTGHKVLVIGGIVIVSYLLIVAVAVGTALNNFN